MPRLEYPITLRIIFAGVLGRVEVPETVGLCVNNHNIALRIVSVQVVALCADGIPEKINLLSSVIIHFFDFEYGPRYFGAVITIEGLESLRDLLRVFP